MREFLFCISIVLMTSIMASCEKHSSSQQVSTDEDSVVITEEIELDGNTLIITDEDGTVEKLNLN